MDDPRNPKRRDADEMVEVMSAIGGNDSFITQSARWLAPREGDSDIDQLREVTGPAVDQLRELARRAQAPQLVEAVLTHAINVWETRLSRVRKKEGRKALVEKLQVCLLVTWAGVSMSGWEIPSILNILATACGVLGIFLTAMSALLPKDYYGHRLSSMIHAAKMQRSHLHPDTSPEEATEIARRVHALYDALQPARKDL